VYTPQLIVNGKKECLGSDEAAVNAAVKNAVAKESNVNLDLKARQQGNNIQISYSINGNSPANKLLIAVIEKHAVREIGDGENRGKTLNHAQIVRGLSSFSITGNKGVEQISLPVDYKVGNYEIVGFLQDENTDEIVSAARAQDHG
jgi:hypothetical protein